MSVSFFPNRKLNYCCELCEFRVEFVLGTMCPDLCSARLVKCLDVVMCFAFSFGSFLSWINVGCLSGGFLCPCSLCLEEWPWGHCVALGNGGGQMIPR